MNQRELLFTYAILTDTHIKPKGGDESSPYQVNLLSEDRSRMIVGMLNRLSPDFVIHLGDITHPVPTLPTYDSGMQLAKDIFSGLDCPLHTVPGNHDIGDKPLSWMPGPKTTADHIKRYGKFWDEDYASFDWKGIHFVSTNSSIWNSGSEGEQKQWDWLEEDLEANRDKRIMLFTHYPLFIFDPDEEENYDNIGEPARSRLLNLIDTYSIESVYAGHVHHFFYHYVAGAHQYIVPSAAFLRPDYMEMFEAEPAPDTEGGRNDKAKFGFMLVKVYADGHENRFVRTDGDTGEKFKESIETDHGCKPAIRERQAAHWAKNDSFGSSRLGAYLRHPWAQPHVLPYGNVDDFNRKVVYNDYPLLALWGLGIRKLRIPISDLQNVRSRERMKMLLNSGHEFTVFSLSIPGKSLVDLVTIFPELVRRWEWILDRSEISQARETLTHLKSRISTDIYWSVIETSADAERRGTKFYHFVRHGFKHDNLNLVWDDSSEQVLPDGIVYRLGSEDDPLAAIEAASSSAKQSGMSVSVHLQMQGSNNPAVSHRNDWEIASRVLTAFCAAESAGNIDLFLDTWMDHDRGYYIRNGIIDRRGNPRIVYDVLNHMSTILNTEFAGFTFERLEAADPGDVYMLQSNDNYALLLLSNDGDRVGWQTLRLPERLSLSDHNQIAITNLYTNLTHEYKMKYMQNDNGSKWMFSSPIDTKAPLLLRFTLH